MNNLIAIFTKEFKRNIMHDVTINERIKSFNCYSNDNYFPFINYNFTEENIINNYLDKIIVAKFEIILGFKASEYNYFHNLAHYITNITLNLKIDNVINIVNTDTIFELEQEDKQYSKSLFQIYYKSN